MIVVNKPSNPLNSGFNLCLVKKAESGQFDEVTDYLDMVLGFGANIEIKKRIFYSSVWNCFKCKKQVPEDSETCPHCGSSQVRKPNDWKIVKTFESFGIEPKETEDGHYEYDEKDLENKECWALLYKGDSGYMEIYDVIGYGASEEDKSNLFSRFEKARARWRKKTEPVAETSEDDEAPF